MELGELTRVGNFQVPPLFQLLEEELFFFHEGVDLGVVGRVE